MNNRFRLLVPSLLVFISLILHGCGGGNSPAPATEVTEKTISGQVLAPAGQVAYFREKSLIDRTVDFVFPGAYAGLTGLGPVSNAEVSFIRIDAIGAQQGEALAKTTTDADGKFSVAVSLDLKLDATLIAQVKGQNGKIQRAFILGDNVTIDPRSEFLVRSVLSSSIDVTTVSPSSLDPLAQTVAGIDVAAAGDIEATIQQLAQGAGGGFDNQLNALSNDQVRPTLAGAISKSNTSVLVSFSESMGLSAADPTNYSIVLENVQTEAGGLAVLSAVLSEDKRAVTLTTASQGGLTYRVTAVNVRDLAGNIIAQKTTGVGSEVDPASAVFAGTAPSLVKMTVASGENGIAGWQDLNGNGTVDAGDGLSDMQGNTFLLKDADGDGVVDNWDDKDGDGVVSAGDEVSGLLDSDLDGLQDSTENQGWTVTVKQEDGSETTKQVTSDPFNADTDGDKLGDFEEFTTKADPRNADTDGDSISDYDEYNVVFSSLTNKDSDGDGLPDLDEYQYYFTSPIVADSDGDGISDADELDQNRNPRIADRPKFAIDVKSVNLTLDEDYSYTDEHGTEQTISTDSSVTLAKDESVSTTHTDAGIDEVVGHVEAQLEAGFDNTGSNAIPSWADPPIKAVTTVGGGASWTNTSSWQTDKTSAKASSQAYENSLSKGEALTNTNSYTRNVTGGAISVSVDVLNKGNFTLTFNDIQISVLKRQGDALVPIATLTAEGSSTLQISPLNGDGKGKDLIFSTTSVPANVVEELMKNVPALVFKVSNYDLADNDGVSFASTDEGVFNKTAGIVIDYGDIRDAEHYLVSVAGSNDVDHLVGGGWQGGIDGEGHPRGVSLDYALQDIVGFTRHYRHDTIEAGLNGTLDTALDETSDDVLEGDRILPGENGWLETQPTGDDVVKSILVDRDGNPSIIEQGIIAGPDRVAASVAVGDDVQEVPVNTQGIPYGTVVVSAGPDKILQSAVASGDIKEYIGGYETSRTCLGNASTVGAICTLDKDCNTPTETQGLCRGPERIARINTLRAGDLNRDWFVFKSADMPTSADFSKINIMPGQTYRLAFLQDLDRDGLSARTEKLYGSIDSGINVLDNRKFGKNFNLDAAKAAGPGDDVFADSKDSDHDGLDDYAEIKVGWTIQNQDGSLTRVFPHPGLADSDGDGLEDSEEMDLRGFCATDGSEWRKDALCAFQNEAAVSKADATAIIAGKNGIAESVLAGDDVAVAGKEKDTTGLLYGAATILPGDNGVIDTDLAGDDLYVGKTAGNIPASNPRLKDTDNDGVDDRTELTGFSTGDVVVDGGNGVADTNPSGDDMALVILGTEMRPHGVIITPGVNGTLETVPLVEEWVYGNGDDYVDIFGNLLCGANHILDTIALGTDQAQVAFGTACSPNAFGVYVGITHPVGVALQTKPNLIEIKNPGATGDDKVRAGKTVFTDPLRADSDGDNILDGLETIQGTDPTQQDTPDFLDQDHDGLTDYVEQTGWNITINGTQYHVTTDPNVADSDGDGLPDLVEKDIGSSPVTDALKGLNGDDSDGDGLKDYEEFNNFAKYAGYSALFTGFQLVNDGGDHYGTSPAKADVDGDGLNDYEELMTYHTSPTKRDTDGDGLTDGEEVNGSWTVTLANGTSYAVVSDPTLADADGDFLYDYAEKQLKTDPTKANTDDDAYGVSDYMEQQLGTDPLDGADRCVVVSYDTVKLDNGVDGTDDGGDVYNVVSANHVNVGLVDQKPGDDIYAGHNSYMGVGGIDAYPATARTTMVLKAFDKIKFRSEAAYRDYGIAAWSPTIASEIFVTQNSDLNAAETTIPVTHEYTWGNIKITTRATVKVLTNSANGSCQ